MTLRRTITAFLQACSEPVESIGRLLGLSTSNNLTDLSSRTITPEERIHNYIWPISPALSDLAINMPDADLEHWARTLLRDQASQMAQTPLLKQISKTLSADLMSTLPATDELRRHYESRDRLHLDHLANKEDDHECQECDQLHIQTCLAYAAMLVSEGVNRENIAEILYELAFTDPDQRAWATQVVSDWNSKRRTDTLAR